MYLKIIKNHKKIKKSQLLYINLSLLRKQIISAILHNHTPQFMTLGLYDNKFDKKP